MYQHCSKKKTSNWSITSFLSLSLRHKCISFKLDSLSSHFFCIKYRSYHGLTMGTIYWDTINKIFLLCVNFCKRLSLNIKKVENIIWTLFEMELIWSPLLRSNTIQIKCTIFWPTYRLSSENVLQLHHTNLARTFFVCWV